MPEFNEVDIKNVLKIVDSLSRQVDTVARKLETLDSRFDALESLVDRNDQNIRRIVSDQAESLNSLKVGIYGDSKYRFTGMVERQEKLEVLLNEQMDDRKSQKDKLRGIQIGLGITGLGTILTFISNMM